jgi:hypothetical protein
MKDIRDVIRDRLCKSLINRLPQEACIPYKPHPGSYISLRNYLKQDHPLLGMRNIIASKEYSDIIKQIK